MEQERYNQIIHHPMFQECMERIALAEQTRIFCGHGLNHLLDVCRLAYIMNLEDASGIPKDVVYAAGLLHDLGRAAQYENGVDHAVESARLAPIIMEDCQYTSEEISEVTGAILHHRNEGGRARRNILGEYLYIADKRSRNCFQCKAYEECNWAKEKKNTGVY